MNKSFPSCEELIKIKLLGLFHDPPNKPLAILGRGLLVNRRNKNENREGKKYHEIEAEAWLKELTGLNSDDFPTSVKERIKEADRLASSVDRWIITFFRDINKLSNKVVYINQFNPSLIKEIDYSKIDNASLERYLKVLEEIVSIVDSSDYRLKYHLLYTFMEPLWYKEIGYVPPVADTRTPTHTLFDHLSAVTSFLNIFNGKDFEGYLVQIDIPGIQDFVTSGRGPGDWWAGSWLISALAWYTVAELVWELGPDIMVDPTARYNPFYFDSLNSMITSISQDYKKLIEKLRVAFLRADQPTMPATVTLLLPKCALNFIHDKVSVSGSEEKVIEAYFRERYLRLWHALRQVTLQEVEELKENCEEVSLEEVNKNSDGCFVIREVKEEFEKETLPPKLLNVTVLNLKDVYNEYNHLIDNKDVEKKVNQLINELEKYDKQRAVREVKQLLFYHWLFTTKLPQESKKRKKFKLNMSPMYDLELKERFWKKGIRYPLCSCGNIALIVNKKEKGVRYIKAKESLCPYCLLKRALSKKPDKFLEEVIKRLDSKPLLPRNVGGARRVGMDIQASLPEIVYLVMKRSGKNINEVVKELSNVTAKVFDKRWRDELEELREAFRRLGLTDENDLEEIVKRVRNNSSKYFTLLKADGDGMGDMKSGKLYAFSDNFEDEIAHRYGKILDYLNSDNDKDKRTIDEDTKRKIINIVRNILEIAHSLSPKTLEASSEEPSKKDKPTVLFTPSIQAQLSYTTMIGALIDSQVIDSLFGTVVYAGGDDLVAILPAAFKSLLKEKLRNVEELTRGLLGNVLTNLNKGERALLAFPGALAWALTREFYWGLKRGAKGFRILTYGSGNKSIEAFAPAPAVYGRKYGLVISHYREPLKLVYEKAGEAEEESSKLKRKFGNITLPKDGVAIAYGRGRIEEFCILPNTMFLRSLDSKAGNINDLPLPEKIGESLELIIKGKLSRSAYRDVVQELERLFGNELFDKELEKRVALYIVGRNLTVPKRSEEGKLILQEIDQLLEKLKEESDIVEYNDKKYDPFLVFFKALNNLLGGAR